MCGINGCIIKKSTPYNLLDRINKMNQSLLHRGPDDQGTHISLFWTDFSFAFGQARLSIVDLSPAGHQPMFYSKDTGAFNENFHPNDSHDLSIVFNGEIYNYSELRKELEDLGYIFATHSDTEIILAWYLAWGTDAVKKFNGMWAFCLHDASKDIFYCSRDRFGKKPFYYYESSDEFIFSSEIKWILEHSELGINKKENINPEALDFYFTVGYIPAPITIYKNIRKLEAWENLIIRNTDGKLEFERSHYYEIPDFAPEENRERLIQEWKELLADAVKIRMFSADVPVGAFLSGGLDSSSVVAEMTKHTEKSKLHTFSVGFEWRYDETPYIDIVKNAFGTNHHHAYFIETDFEKILEHISFNYDEPFGDYSSFPTTFVSELARKDVTVALSWDGGDEIFGGYMMHKVAAQMEYLYILPVALRRFFSKYIPETRNNLSLLSKLKEAFRVSLFPKEDFYAELGGSTLYRPESYKLWTRMRLRYLLKKNNGSFTQSIIDFDLLYNTIPDNFLVKVDRASMTHSLEVRNPFLDYRFVELARRIPVKWKVTTNKTKILMRDIIAGIVPDAIVSRPKQGFEPPIAEWILGDVYIASMKKWLEELYSQGILSSEWYSFYKDSVFSGNNQVFNVFKIKLFLLLKWKKQWIK